MDLNVVQDELAADDGLDQRVINSILDEDAYDEHTQRQRYKDTTFKRVKLSVFRDIFDKKQAHKSFQLMRQRTEIILDDDFTYKSNNTHLAWDLSQHFLDFLLVVSAKVGFHAILPNTPNDHHFVFDLDLHQPSRVFKAKHADLGFSSERRLLFIGKSRGKDEVWLAMAPLDFFVDDPDRPLNPTKAVESSCLTGPHYWMLVMYFAFLLHRIFPQKSVFCSNPYPNIDVDPRLRVQIATNVL